MRKCIAERLNHFPRVVLMEDSLKAGKSCPQSNAVCAGRNSFTVGLVLIVCRDFEQNPCPKRGIIDLSELINIQVVPNMWETLLIDSGRRDTS